MQNGNRKNSSPCNYSMISSLFFRDKIDGKLWYPLTTLLNYIVNYNLDNSKVIHNDSVYSDIYTKSKKWSPQ